MTSLAPARYPVSWIMLSMLLLTSVPTVLLLVVLSKTVTDIYYKDWTRSIAERVASTVQPAATIRDVEKRVAAALYPYHTAKTVQRVSSESVVSHITDGVRVQTETPSGTLSVQAFVFPKNPFAAPRLYIALSPRPSSECLVVTAALSDVIPGFTYHITMLATVSGALLLLIIYNSLIYAATIEQKLTAAETHRRRLQGSLLQTSKLAAMGTLSAGIAHELNTPISIMVQEAGWIEDVLKDAPNTDEAVVQEITTSTHVIAEQGNRCKDITHNLLSVSRKDLAQSSIVNVNSLVQEVVLYASSRAGSIAVDIATELDSVTPYVEASLTHIQQILCNLIANALDALEPTGGTVVVTTTATAERVDISVTDTGSGIPDELHTRVFEPFFTTKPAGKGTGLGLSICHSLAIRNGGTLRVSSVDGAGCVFTLSLPRYAGSQSHADAVSANDKSMRKGASHDERSS
ncbi:MAG: HAMP domain-containing histidine kinase [Desulfovibrionales bacterium]|nr:HAMP domain-containing histidine kinase [Desulfovibrionales bacterium]